MSSEHGDRRPASRIQHGGSQQPEPELACPRCESRNTKFCYYNNYNLSQPRHFCKSCRRYWTRGGTLRNIPVGGATRRNPNKRSRTTTTTPPSSSSPYSLTYCDPNPEPIKTDTASLLFADVNLHGNVPGTESFSSLLNPPGSGSGFFALERFGIGIGLGTTGSGFREMGFGLGDDGVWHTEEEEQVGVGGGGGGGGGSVVSSDGCNMWQIGSVGEGGGLADGDCFGWPDLAISTPAKGGLK
ncbi:unnamed protein product [Camellia sinensis]